jgi:hypothetical protein
MIERLKFINTDHSALNQDLNRFHVYTLPISVKINFITQHPTQPVMLWCAFTCLSWHWRLCEQSGIIIIIIIIILFSLLVPLLLLSLLFNDTVDCRK